MMLLISTLLLVLSLYVLYNRRLSNASDNRLRLVVCVVALFCSVYNVYLFVRDVLVDYHYAQAAHDLVVYGTYVYIFRLFWLSLGARLYREKAGVISARPVWVFTYDHYTHINPSVFGLVREVVSECSDDKHLGEGPSLT